MQLIKCKRCTHIKVTGHPCGSPALRGEHFCYFHARMIKGVRLRVDARVNPSALLEDPESIQVAIMDITTQLLENSIDWRRASLIIRALQIAVRNAKNVHFGCNRRRMVREVPNWDRQWMDEHGETPLTKEEFSAVRSQPSATSEERSPVQQPSPTHANAELNRETSHPGQEPGACPEPPQADLPSPTLNSPENGHPDSLANCHPEQSDGSARASLTTEAPTPAQPSLPASLSSRQTRQWRKLRRVQRSIAGARRGDLAGLKRVVAFAGLDK
ncbi:MAG TPA: hypothetical protein VL135_11325 [Terracidiphilus sp.]|nr:hypothetical protein [Terracidiphilus sp.]